MAPDTAFYDQRAASYAAASHDMDLRPLYARFLPHVRPGGRISRTYYIRMPLQWSISCWMIWAVQPVKFLTWVCI